MKIVFFMAAFSSWNAVASAQIVYILPPEEAGISVQTLDQESFVKESKRYAKAASLSTERLSGDFELRIWRTDVMFGGAVGFVIRDGKAHVFDIKRRDSRYTATSISTRKIAVSQPLIAAVHDVSMLAGNEYSCGIADGESVLIEAFLEGKAYRLRANNPESCKDKHSKRIANLLNVLNVEARGREL